MASDDESFVDSSLLNDRNVPLDHDLLSTIVSSLLNLKDVKRSFDLPVFRVLELLTIVRRISTSLLNEMRLTDSVLAFYALCLHYAVNTNIDASVVVELLTLLQFLSIESLIVEQTNRRPQSLEMLPPREVFRKDGSFDIHHKLEIFTENLDIARTIIRDALKLSRTLYKLRTMKAEQRKRAMPKHAECIQPYCLYFVANLALCHVTTLLHQTGNIILCPGNTEVLLVNMLTTVVESRASSAGEARRSEPKPTYNYAQCVITAQKLASFVGHYVLDEKLLEMKSMLQAKFTKKLTHLDIKYIHYRVSTLRCSLSKTPPADGMLTGKISFAPGTHFYSEFRTIMNVDQPPRTVEDDDTSVELSSVATPSPSLMASSMVSSGAKSEQASLSTSLFNTDAKRVQHYWELKTTFRPLFLTLSSLMRENTFPQGFSAEYRPQISDFPQGNILACSGVKSLSIAAALKVLESHYFYWCSKDYLPHILNPLNEMYWICAYIVDYLAKMAENGQGFCPSLLKEKQFLQKKLKEKRITQTVHSASSQVPFLPPMRSAKSSKKPHTARTVKKKSTDLAVLLSAAKSEAQLECRMDRIDAQLRGLSRQGSFLSADGETEDDDEGEGNDYEDDDGVAQILKDARPATPWFHPDVIKSVVWHCAPKSGVLVRTTVFAGIDEAADDPMQNLPPKSASIEYARKLYEEKQRKIDSEENFRHLLEDQQEAILSKNRATKTAMLRDMRVKMKEDLQLKSALKKQWDIDQRKMKAEERFKAQRMEQEKATNHLRELHRIRIIKEMKKFKEDRAAEEHAFIMERESHIISRIASQKEADAIRRMLHEENMMRQQEERRRAIEEKLQAKKDVETVKEQARHEKSMEKVDRMQARVRMGNFVWHNGQFGFYDGVRKKPVKYIEYEDEYGAYYYDPINATSQRRRPNDAPIEHYTEGERREYDAVHGVGAYDAYKEDIAFKDSVNQLGGYYDENGNWIVARGYYDENYEWVEYDGYYNEEGRYIKYPKIQGNLDFMV